MQKKVPLSVTVTSIVCAVLLTFLSTFIFTVSFTRQTLPSGTGDSSVNSAHAYNDLLNELQGKFDSVYIGEIDEDVLADYVAAGFVAGTGDKYAAYYNPEDYAAVKEDMAGEMQGIGVSVIYNGDAKAIEIINVFPDSPAFESGLEPGDLIKYVSEDGEEYQSVAAIGYDIALNMLRGKAGTNAMFIAYRGESSSEPVYYDIPRRAIAEQTVEYRVYGKDSTVGVIKITAFDGKTPEQFEKALDELTSNGVDKLVFDVRNNPGGELVSVCTILDRLLPEGPIIRTIDKSGVEKTVYVSDKNELEMPMAVVVNSSTASAAELFSSSLQDYKKANVVGTVTYGKGCMQTLYNMKNGGCISLTTALYCPPFSDNYDGIGVIPDIESKLSDDAASKNIYKLTEDEDTQLADAVKSLYN